MQKLEMTDKRTGKKIEVEITDGEFWIFKTLEYIIERLNVIEEKLK